MVLLKLDNDKANKSIKKTSTFHYGSIKIPYFSITLAIESVSTFHYGSIKISPNSSKSKLFIRSTFHYGSIKMGQFRKRRVS